MAFIKMFAQFSPLAEELKNIITIMKTRVEESGEAILRLDELKNSEPGTLPAFCLLLEQQFMPDQVLIQIKNCITKNWDNLPEELRPAVMDFLLPLVKALPNQMLSTILISALCMIYKKVDYEWEGLLEYATQELSENPLLYMNFISELKAATNDTQEGRSKVIEYVTINAEQIIPIALASLQSDSWDMRIKAMELISTLYFTADDQSVLSEHIALVLSFLEQSTTVDEDTFSKLWTAFADIAEIVEFEPEQKMQISQIAFQAASTFSGAATALERPLSSLKPFFGEIGPELIGQILELLFNIAEKLLADEQVIPSEVLSLYTDAAPFYDSDEYYAFIKGKMEISDFSDEEQLNTFIVAFTILNEVFKPLIKQFKNDFEFYAQVFSECAETGNEMLLNCICFMIYQFDERFEKQIIEKGLFLDILVPSIVSENKELRTVAINATFNMLDIIRNPIPGVFQKIWSVFESVDPSVLSMYLRLLAKSIETEQKLDQETIGSLITIIIEWLSNEDLTIVCGAITMATILISLDETSHEALVAPTIAGIQQAIESEQDESMKCAFESLNNIINALKGDVLPLIGDLVEVTVEKATAEIFSPIKSQSAKSLINLAIVSGDAAITEKAASVIIEAASSDDPNTFQEIVLESLPIACNIIAFEALAQIFELICKAIKQFGEVEIASDSLICLERVLAKYHGENIGDLTSIAAKLVIDYANEQWAIQSKLTSACDAEELTSSVLGFVAEFFHAPFEGIEDIFTYVGSLMESEDEDVIDSVASVIGAAAENNLIPEEMGESVVQFAVALVTAETSEELYQNTVYMLGNLLKSKILAPEFFAERIDVLVQWDAEAETEEDKDARTCIAYLLMVLVIDFGFPVHELFLKGLEEFPPSDGSDIIDMLTVFNRIFQNEELCRSIPEQILSFTMKALSIPSVLITRYEIPLELLQTLSQATLAMFGQEAVSQEIQKQDQVSIARISNFYQ